MVNYFDETSLGQWIKETNNFLKLFVIINFTTYVFVVGSIPLIIFSAFNLLLLIIIGYHRKGITILLAISFAHVLIFMPFSNKQEISELIIFSLRLFNLMVIGIVSGIFFRTKDLYFLLDKIGVSETYKSVILSTIKFIPISIAKFIDVIYSQKSRGLEFNLNSVFNINTYLSLIIPYINIILREIYNEYITISLRIFSFSNMTNKLQYIDAIVFSFVILFWIIEVIFIF